MFTGLTQKVGSLARIEKSGASGTITIAHDPWDVPLAPGESVAVQGVCLTVVRADSNQFVCDLLAETLKRTNLAAAGRGTPLNLERALRAGDRLGGHFVTGHTDGTGSVVRLERAGADWMNLIPFTWQNTSLRRLKVGEVVNLETDLIGKHVRRFMEGRERPAPLTWDKLHDAGFV